MSSFVDALRNLKHSRTMPQACPACGSVRIKQQGSLSGWFLPPMYRCLQCGYFGSLVLELEEVKNEDHERNIRVPDSEH
jgi:predicted RNA-binding Zn-ribbon protein involved in translation (DUF1610 family)